eukprot:11537802-Alexandrium_andersonii.AAC.1
MRQWPKRCVILGAEGYQWPFMRGVGHNVLADHLRNIGDQLVLNGVPVVHGRHMWEGLQPARDGMHLTWELAAVFK